MSAAVTLPAPGSRWLLSTTRRLLSLVAVLLTACGGGSATDGDAPDQVRETNAVYARTADVPGYEWYREVKAFGVSGYARTGNYLTVPDAAVVSLVSLTGPYGLSNRRVSTTTGQSVYFGAIAFEPGSVNVTSLTTLAVGQLYGTDPSAFFDGLAIAGDTRLSRATPEGLAVAQTRVLAYLQRRLGITPPQGLGDFFTAPFEAKAGDPMFDLMAALDTTLAARSSDVVALAGEIAAEAARCDAERLTVTVAGVAEDFCPSTKATVPDETDLQVVVYSFTSSGGASIVLRARSGVLSSVSYQAADSAPASTCSDAACVGVVLGTPAADGSRPVSFSATRLSGAGGDATLDGALQAPKPGPAFPVLGCDNRYFIAYPDNVVESACAAQDNSIQAGYGDATRVGGERVSYVFQSDGSVEPMAAQLQVRAEGETLVGIFVTTQDPATGQQQPLFHCAGTACAGVTIGPARDDPDSFAPYILRYRQITIDDATLPAVPGSTGTPTVGGAIVRAQLDSFEIIYPDGFWPTASPCGSADQRLEAALPYLATPVEVCPPASLPDGFVLDQLVYTTVGDGGNLSFFIGSFYGSAGSDSGGIRINMVGDTVASATFTENYGATYRCLAAACSGITVSAPDAGGRRAIRFESVTLQELEVGDVSGDRAATVNGAFTAPPPP